MNIDTTHVLSNLGLTPDKLTISGNATADSLFHPLTTYTSIERVNTGLIFNNSKKGNYEIMIALIVGGDLFAGNNFSVWVNYFSGSQEGIKIGEKYEKTFNAKIDLMLDSGLKRLEDYLYRCQDGRYNYTYRSRTEIKP